MNGLAIGSGGALRRLTEGLSLAAAPSFLAMALLAGLPGDSAAMNVFCITGDHASPFGGMVPMYLLMAVFHLPPWLKLLPLSGES